MIIHPAGSRPSTVPDAAYFTGTVRMDPINAAPEPARLRAILVTFEPGARTNWHTHPYGQTLMVTTGAGRVQKEGEEIQTIRPGDVVWIPPGEKHWHGAGPDTAMSHIAMQEAEDGATANWMEPVTDAQYGG
ncbi:cupin domain-containing protein [Sulfitobacter sp. HNIBRBA3233]|uniref:(R)-mandelonitrile lyase n=1 Tax=Sulfitobacter marinivivus TaxID=3158558 RepID=UPI0032DF1AD2